MLSICLSPEFRGMGGITRPDHASLTRVRPILHNRSVETPLQDPDRTRVHCQFRDAGESSGTLVLRDDQSRFIRYGGIVLGTTAAASAFAISTGRATQE